VKFSAESDRFVASMADQKAAFLQTNCLHAIVIPAKAGIHLDLAFRRKTSKQDQNQNGSQLSLG
jgi:hypothetical protein